MCEKEEREITQFQMQGGGERRQHIILHILLGREMQGWYDLEDTEIKRLTTSWIAGIDLLTNASMPGGGWLCACKGSRAQGYDNGLQML